MTWTPRSTWPSASRCCITAGSSSRARAPKSSRTRRPARCILATEALTLQGVDALYGDSHVLHGISFEVGAGRVLALLGRNGAGKTTCMSAIIGFPPPRKGAIPVLVEQNVRLALELADEVVILNTGRVAFTGSAGEARGNEALITQHLGVF